MSAAVLTVSLGVRSQPRAQLEQAARANRNDAAAQRALGMAQLKAWMFRDAEAQLRKASRLVRGAPESLYDIARVAFERNDYRAAQSACRPLRRAAADWNAVCEARTFLVWRRAAAAQGALEVVARPTDGVLAYEWNLAMGDAYRMQVDAAHARESYATASRLLPGAPEPWIALGRLALQTSSRSEAETAFRRALEADAESPDALFELGKIGPRDESVAMLERALAARPSWSDAQISLGLAYVTAARADDARRLFEAALRANPNSAEAHVGLARAHMASGEMVRAEQSVQRALALVPNSQTAGIALAEIEAATDRPDDAFATYRRAADMNAQNPEPLLAAARLAISLHREVLAQGFLDRVMGVSSDLPAALALYGDARRGQRDLAGARDYYRRALGAPPSPIVFDRTHVETSLREVEALLVPRRP